MAQGLGSLWGVNQARSAGVIVSELPSYRVPGFAWVRLLTSSILFVFLLLVSGVAALVMIAEMDVTVAGTGSVEPRKRSRV